MRVLREGMSGDDVQSWQNFLTGQHKFFGVVDSQFGNDLTTATEDFQRSYHLGPDGAVGPETLGQALLLGFNPLTDSDNSDTGPNWPPKPDFSPLDEAGKQSLFGSFTYVPDPQPGNPESIKITDNWVSQNIVTIPIPQLSQVQYSPKNCEIQFHTKAAKQLQDLFALWENIGLLNHVLTWGGSYAPRFIRGSRTILSNHAYGSAFDINVPWNPLGARPALKGQHGSTRELVDSAVSQGFYWGGWFGRQDGMHFEIAGLM
jgi:hypothetical protein